MTMDSIPKQKKVLISGITGQDGSFASEMLLAQGYEIHGIVRRAAIEDPNHRMIRINHIKDKLHLHAGSLDSYPSVFSIVQKVKPDYIIHYGAQSYVSYSFEDTFSTMHTNVNGTHYMLEAIRQCCPEARYYFSGSSEMFGKVHSVPQNEDTPFHPRSSYGISKVVGYYLTQNYRESYGMFCVSGVLFNHESERRGFEFVTRKISSSVARIKRGKQTELVLGNLDAKRDWGYAPDYVNGAWLMLQQDNPEDFVLATGETHSVEEFCNLAFNCVGLDYRNYIKTNPAFIRPAEVDLLLGDASKAKAKLGWEPTVKFEQLVEKMVINDLQLVDKGKL